MKQIIKKIFISIMLLSLLTVTVPINSNAFNGGVLIEPIEDLLIFIGDSVLNLLQKVFLPYESYAVSYVESEATVNAGFLENIAAKALDFAPVTALAGLFYGEEYIDEMLEPYQTLIVTNIKYGPATIFFGNIELFDINFIKEEKQYGKRYTDRHWIEGEYDLDVTKEDFKQKITDYLTKYHYFTNTETGKYSYSTSFDNTFETGKREWISWEKGDKEYLLYFQYRENDSGLSIYESTITEGELILTSQSKLRMVISNIYVIVRNIVIVSFAIILVYIAIKILISSTSASDKAKYKQMLKDWLVGLCLAFLLHIIMFGILEISEQIISIFKGNLITGDDQDVLLSMIRYQITYSEDMDRVGYIIMYLVLIMYTIMFSIQYLKRLIYVIFLTIIAPFVALTYPLDKLKDGKSQAFNMWLKEYVYNVIIQILHVILYYILVNMAIELALTNMIYSLVAIGFMLEAEKILKAMFGFDAKGGMFGGKPESALAGALAMNAINKLAHIKRRHGGNDRKDDKSDSNNDNKMRTKDDGKNINTLLGGEDSSDSDVNEDSPNDNLNNDENANNPESEGTDNSNGDIDDALEKYESEGYGKNSFGEYFNPWTDEYNPDYDPHNDAHFKPNYAPHNDAYFKPNKNKKRRKSRAVLKRIKGVTAVGGHFAGKGLKFAAKTGIKLAGAGTLGAVGVAAGLASDDFSDVFKYGAGAAGIGWATAGKATEVPGGIARAVGNIRDEAKGVYRSQVSPNDDKVINKELDQKWQRDKQNDKLYAQKLNTSLKEAQRLKNDIALKYRQYEVTDDKLIIKAMKLDKNKYGNDIGSNDRIAMAKFAGEVKTSKQLEELEKSLMKRAQNEKDKTKFRKILRGVREINDLV